MKITQTVYAKTRAEWRAWLRKNYLLKKEIWLIYYKKDSGMPRVAYSDAVEEALCFGWIDSTVKSLDKKRYCQRFTPRRDSNNWSELNKERVRKLIKAGQMTEAGMKMVQHIFDKEKKHHRTKEPVLVIPPDILKELKKDKTVWNNFQKFPEHYKRVRIGYLDGSRRVPEFFKKRLAYFLKMTAKNKMYGTHAG